MGYSDKQNVRFDALIKLDKGCFTFEKISDWVKYSHEPFDGIIEHVKKY